jgi:hypothetical protein
VVNLNSEIETADSADFADSRERSARIGAKTLLYDFLEAFHVCRDQQRGNVGQLANVMCKFPNQM